MADEFDGPEWTAVFRWLEGLGFHAGQRSVFGDLVRQVEFTRDGNPLTLRLMRGAHPTFTLSGILTG